MDTSIPIHLREDYRRCRRIAARHYENFPVASLLLPRETRPHVAALYAFARTADDFADEPAFEGRRLKELAEWERAFRAALAGKPAPPELQAFAHTVKVFKIPPALPLALLKAFRMDVTVKRYKDWKALLYYCRHSANPVGRMVLLLHGLREERLHLLSDAVCTGLQLINFWQDTAQDLSRGRVYYPATELRKAGVKEKTLLSGNDSRSVRTLVGNVADRTETLFRGGFPLLEKVEGRLRLELKATCWGGLSILNKLRSMDYNVLRQRPKLGPLDKMGIGLKALLDL